MTPEQMTAWATVGLALITGTLAFATFKLWRSTNTLVLGAQETAKHQLRPYLHVKEAMAGIRDDLLVAEVTIENFGQTPAYEVTKWAGLAAYPDGATLVFPPPGPGKRKFKSIIGPGYPLTDIYPGDPVAQLTPFPPDGNIYLYGQLDYKDVFGEHHSTHFRLYVPQHQLTGRFRFCEVGNEAT